MFRGQFTGPEALFCSHKSCLVKLQADPAKPSDEMRRALAQFDLEEYYVLCADLYFHSEHTHISQTEVTMVRSIGWRMLTLNSLIFYENLEAQRFFFNLKSS